MGALAEELKENLTPEPAPAANLLRGRIFSDSYIPAFNSTQSELLQTSTSAWLEYDPVLNDHSKGVIVFQGDAFGTSFTGKKNTFQGKLREAYVTYFQPGIELRAGQQIIPWGKSDGVNPTDYLTARDYTFLNWDEEVRRLGATSIQAIYVPGHGKSPFNLTSVITPVFQGNLLLIGRQSVPASVTQGNTLTPPATLGNTEFALKAAYAGTDFDISLSAFHGFSHQPLFQVQSFSFTPAPTASLAQFFQKESALGGDFSFTRGAFIFRGESAYFFTETPDATLIAQPSHFDTVLGVERPLGHGFRAQAQLYLKYLPNYPQNPPPSLFDTVATFNQLIGGYQDAFKTTTTLRLTYTTSDDAWEFELFNLYEYQRSDGFLRLKASFLITDALRATVGADWNAGPSFTTFGALQDYSSVFTEAKYTF